MPVAVVEFIGAALINAGATATGAFVMLEAGTVSAAAIFAGTMVYGQAAKRKAAGAARRAQDAARAAYIAGLENKLVTSVAVDAPVRYVYGRDKVGCNIVAMLTSGNKDQYRHLVCVIANHEINQIHEVFVNSKPVGFANLSTSGTPSLANWVTWNGDSNTEVIRGGNGTFKLPAGYGNLVVKASATTDFTAGTTLTNGVNYSITNDVLTLNSPYNTNSYYIQLVFSPNAFYTLEQETRTVGFGTTTYTIADAGFTNLSVVSDPGPYDQRTVLTLGTDYTVVGSLITLLAPWAGLYTIITYNYPVGTSRLKIDSHLGAVTDTYDTYLNSVCPGSWTTNHKMTGHAYLVVTLDLNLSEFQNGPPEVQVECSGKKLYDPRTSTTAWSDNPALVIRDYLLSPMCKVPSAALTAVVSSYNTAANACDTSITVGSWTGKKYTVNGVVSADEAASQVLDGLGQAMAGIISGADWSVTAGTFTASVMSLNHMDDVVGGLSVTPGLGRNEICNTIRGRYTGLETKYVATDIKPYVDSTYKSLDGEEIAKDLTFNYTNLMQRCHNLAAIEVEDSRNGLTITGEFSYKVWALRPGDRVQFTSPSTLLNMSAKTFRVTDKSFQFGGPVKLTLKEDDASIWDTSPTVTMDYILTSLLNYTAESTYASNIFGLTAASGDNYLLIDSGGAIVSRIFVSWTDTIGKSLNYVEIQYKRYDDTAWTSVQASGGNPNTFLAPVEDGVIYNIRARIINTMLNKQGPWANISHEVIGKTAPPVNANTLTVTYSTAGQRKFNFAYTSNTKPLDWAGMEIRYVQGNVTTPAWGSMTKLHDGLIVSSPYDEQTLYPGTYTFAICAVDTTGNYSTTPLYYTTSLPQLPEGNVIEERNTTKYGWTSSGGWFVTIGKQLGDAVVAPTTAWSNLGTTWGTGVWGKSSTATQLIVNLTMYFNAPITFNIGMLVDAEGDVVYQYAYKDSLGTTQPTSGPWYTLTPDTTIKTTEIYLAITVNGNTAYSKPRLKSAVVKVFGVRRMVSYKNVTSSDSQGISLVGNTAYLNTTDVAHQSEFNILVNESGSWTWETSMRQPTTTPMFAEPVPYISFYKNGVPAMPSSFNLDVIGYGTRTLDGDFIWS